jgi:predicted metal-dependent hydrolase
MELAETMRAVSHHQIEIGGRRVEYLLVASRTARRLRLRVGLNGVEVVRPANRAEAEVFAFLDKNEDWILDQLKRVERLRKIRVTERCVGKILFRGAPTGIRVEETAAKSRGNDVSFVGGEIVVRLGMGSITPVERSLKNWLRRQARAEIERHLDAVTTRLRKRHRRIYIMEQRTKWGNCSARQNLSFNWQLILAPDFVLRYLVTHEAVHLDVPDHSARFWLTVQSLCPDTERAKQWLSANGTKLVLEFDRAVRDQLPRRR